MAINTPLSELRRMVRAEVMQSLNMAQGLNAQTQYDMNIDRTQKELWEQYEWPHLLYRSTVVPLAANQKFYDYPDDMPFDAITNGYYKDGTNWLPMAYGVAMMDNETDQSWPPRKWQNTPSVTGGVTNAIGQIEVWPIPSQAGEMRFRGQALVNNLISDTSRAVLDDTLIALFAAAEILAAQKAENASLKLQKANQFLRRILANQGAMKRQIAILGGIGSMPGQPAPTPYLDYIPS
jgi:hypothetical protein